MLFSLRSLANAIVSLHERRQFFLYSECASLDYSLPFTSYSIQIRLTPSSYRGDAKRFGERHCLKLYGIPNQFWHPKSDFPSEEDIKSKVDYLLDMNEGLPYLQGDPEKNYVSSIRGSSPLLPHRLLGRYRFFAPGSEGANPEILLRKEKLCRQPFRSSRDI